MEMQPEKPRENKHPIFFNDYSNRMKEVKEEWTFREQKTLKRYRKNCNSRSLFRP